MSMLNRLFFRSRDKPTDSLPGGAFSFLFGGGRYDHGLCAGYRWRRDSDVYL